MRRFIRGTCSAMAFAVCSSGFLAVTNLRAIDCYEEVVEAYCTTPTPHCNTYSGYLDCEPKTYTDPYLEKQCFYAELSNDKKCAEIVHTNFTKCWSMSTCRWDGTKCYPTDTKDNDGFYHLTYETIPCPPKKK